MQALIVTADDFGLHARVNDAVALAHQRGILTCASLMVSAPAASEAVDIARRLPGLRVGLHLTLTDGFSTLARETIPHLTDNEGRFEGTMFGNGVRFFMLPHVRRQLAHEIEAQFEAFSRTGLALDHVNTHKHFHLHPTVLDLIVNIGPRFGMRAMRLPRDVSGSLWLAPWIALVRARLARAGIAHNDWVAGLAATGSMNESAMLATLARAPQGVLELYCHPATEGELPITPAMRGYRHADELAALCSPRIAQALASMNVKCGGFGDVFPAAAGACKEARLVS
ncbi:hopanoid biosynthesis-associated protein HpnK [Caballeronia sp. Lep1P3]|uniref:hopanoid biosynthesis-associated protein HpnK n=1 Tax=Caballeronia sp. Lep1P3 TaxID=2878150 RepID=UPI001FD1EC3F|nr:hopanoid biosynthesis-associated protein HpnK [Caballeronia sp. Lep1P3]